MSILISSRHAEVHHQIQLNTGIMAYEMRVITFGLREQELYFVKWSTESTILGTECIRRKGNHGLFGTML